VSAADNAAWPIGHDGRRTDRAVDRDASKHVLLGMGQVTAGRASRRRSRAPCAEWAASVWPRSRCHRYPSLGDGRTKSRIVEQCGNGRRPVEPDRQGIPACRCTHRGENGELSPPGRRRSSPLPSLGLAARGGRDAFMDAGDDRNASCPEGLTGAGPGKTRQQYNCADFASSGSRRHETS
jgi:hypothetical protein